MIGQNKNDWDDGILGGWKDMPLEPHFDGTEYQPEFDFVRLTGQLSRIFMLMSDGRWRTLIEIEWETGDPAASISAQLRNLRKPRFGGHIVEKRCRGNRSNGLFEYRVVAK